MPTKSLETLRKHGIKGGHLGCPCPTCREAINGSVRRRRDRQRQSAAEAAGKKLTWCPVCDREFWGDHGLRVHEHYCAG